MSKYVFDIETDGLDATKIHCLSYQDVETGVKGTLTTYDDIREFISSGHTLIGHNIIRYDLPVLKNILGVIHTGGIVDTLGLSWYLWPKRAKHGLDPWGATLGIEKPKVTDWEDQPLEVYIHRCEEDVQINVKLYNYLLKKLKVIYRNHPERMQSAIDYCNFKLDCAREQEEVQWKLDVDRAQRMVDELEGLRGKRFEELRQAMPKVPVYGVHTRPKNLHKQDGTLTKAGERWFDRLRGNRLPVTHKDDVKYVKEYVEANPASVPQVKDWLTSLGWEPRTFDYVKEDDGSERAIPQVRDGGELCESVKELVDKEPAIELLEGLTVVQHRLGIFKNFLKYAKGGYLKAGVKGFTNTMRFKHANPLVNLPGVDKPYGEDIRGCLVSDEGEVLCGADLSSLEATTKAHFIYPFDKAYAEELTKDDFDEHLDLAVQAGALTRDDYNFYVNSEGGNDKWNGIHKVRKKFKPVNYSAIYGIGKKKLAREMGVSEQEAQDLLTAYWTRNEPVTKFVDSITDVVHLKNGEMWVFNPVSRLYYSLRFEKDKFSTLNQGTGAYVFDTWVKYCRQVGVRFCGQFHDEHISFCADDMEQEEELKKILQEALDKANQELKLNVEVHMECKFGKNYAEVH